MYKGRALELNSTILFDMLLHCIWCINPFVTGDFPMFVPLWFSISSQKKKSLTGFLKYLGEQYFLLYAIDCLVNLNKQYPVS